MIKRERLDKVLSNMGYGSRKDVKKMIKSGRVKVNGEICKKNDIKINPYEDIVFVDGIQLEYREYIYLMMNKPQDVVSSTDDPISRTVIDLIEDYWGQNRKGQKKYYPGPIDFTTNGGKVMLKVYDK